MNIHVKPLYKHNMNIHVKPLYKHDMNIHVKPLYKHNMNIHVCKHRNHIHTYIQGGSIKYIHTGWINKIKDER